MTLEIDKFDLDEIAMALADQSLYDEHVRLVSPETGEIVFWTSEGGIDGETPIDVDDLDLVGIRPLPSYVWYQDMVDFTDRVSDERAARTRRGDAGRVVSGFVAGGPERGDVRVERGPGAARGHDARVGADVTRGGLTMRRLPGRVLPAGRLPRQAG